MGGIKSHLNAKTLNMEKFSAQNSIWRNQAYEKSYQLAFVWIVVFFSRKNIATISGLLFLNIGLKNYVKSKFEIWVLDMELPYSKIAFHIFFSEQISIL